MQSGQRLISLGAIAVILAGVVGFYYYRRSDAPPPPGKTITLNGICLACRKEVTVTHHFRERQPIVCPECGEQAVYGTCYCPHCKLRVIPKFDPPVGGEPPRVPMIRECRFCGGRTIAYIPFDPEHQKAPLGELPKWPPD